MELAAPKTLTIPCRWSVNNRQLTSVEAQNEIAGLAEIVKEGTRAIAGVYMRLCDVIRDAQLSDDDVRTALRPHFKDARISEILRVSRAPYEVYSRYSAGFFGFKATLSMCRGFRVPLSPEMRRRKIRRAAERLISLLDGPQIIPVRGRVVRVE